MSNWNASDNGLYGIKDALFRIASYLERKEEREKAIKDTPVERDLEKTRPTGEPLIKDEKIRKVVRAWYDLNTNKNFAVFCEDGCTLSIGHSARIEFLDKVFDDIKQGYAYPIIDLCGEEE